MPSPEDASPRTTSETPPSADDLAVIVCAYTEERWTEILDAIGSLQAEPTPPGEIVLVIDHNTDLYERAVEAFPSGVMIVNNSHKNGLSGARNSGIAASNRPILAFLDDDAAVDTGWVTNLLAPYADEDVVGVGGDIKPNWINGRPSWWPEEFDWVIGCTYKGHATERKEIRNAIGANMSVRRAAFDAVGGFSSGLGRVGKHPVGAEETELYIRINHWRPETKVIFEPSASVRHNVPASRATFTYFRKRCYAEGLSKAIVSTLVGSNDGLSSEWDYTLKTLPLGALQGFADGLKGDISGFKRGSAIVAGLLITTLGYARGTVAKKPERVLVEVPPSSEVA